MSIDTSYNDYRKKELTFNLNAFDQPMEISGPSAWAQLILNIAYMEEGTIPSQPMIGCNFNEISYQTENTIRDSHLSKLDHQVRTYLPDIPLDSISFEMRTYNGVTVGIFIIKFLSEMLDVETVVAAASRSSTGLLNIQISF